MNGGKVINYRAERTHDGDSTRTDIGCVGIKPVLKPRFVDIKASDFTTKFDVQIEPKSVAKEEVNITYLIGCENCGYSGLIVVCTHKTNREINEENKCPKCKSRYTLVVTRI